MDYQEIVSKQKEFFLSGNTKDINFRRTMLRKLKDAIKANEDAVLEALRQDLSKSSFEGYVSEIGLVYEEINIALRKLPSWAKRRRTKTPVAHAIASSFIYREPYGTVLIISPWNYPFQLSLSPLVGAMAAGNTAMIKPSEYSVHTSQLIERIINDTFPKDYLYVIQGGKEETEALLENNFDYIFFTGSVPVGKIIMTKAAAHLTPVTLELGGKSPCLVTESADIELTAKRIVFGKLFNSGQTCVAPDYLLVHQSVSGAIVYAIKKYIAKFYGDEILSNPDYPKIISEGHFNRLISLMEGKKPLIGGRYNRETLKIEPTIINDVPLADALMTEEIFGPILPLIEYSDLDSAIDLILSHPKPLALYLFTHDKNTEKKVMDRVSFGGGCINDTIIHFSSGYLPIGGVGESGMGNYHGRYSFLTFTHEKAVIKKSDFVDVNLRYPPYTKGKYSIVRKIFK